jgi:hypothetical protein
MEGRENGVRERRERGGKVKMLEKGQIKVKITRERVENKEQEKKD